MADKESAHETIGNGHHHQQAGGYQMPSLTSKPLKQAQVLKDTTNQTEPEAPSGYYFNVAQKGKLILPTALWILLILAGISFLTLLASLNRTVDTLDTLIELEQEKAALESLHHTVHHHEHHEHDKNKPPTGKKYTGQEHHRDEKNWPDSVETSWLALPSWASLEPVTREHSKPAAHRRHDHTQAAQAASGSSADDQLNMLPPEIQSAIDTLLGPADQVDGKNSIVSGSFMFSSVPPQGADAQQPVDDMVDSMMKQMMPMMFPGLKSNKNKISNQELAAKQRNHDSDEAKSSAGSLLSANIENLNINVNISGPAQSDDTEKESGADRKRRPAKIEREESDELEQSLDNMISKLIGPSKLINEPNKPIVMDLGGLQAAAHPLEMIKIGGSLDGDNIHHHGQKSPLSSFMMPIGFGSLLTSNQQTESPLIGSGPLLAPQEHRRPHHHHHQATPDQMIISIASGEPLSNGPLPDFASIFANGALKDTSAAQTPSFKTKHQQLKPASPYELPVGSPMSALLDSIMDPDIGSASKSSDKDRPSFNKSPPKDETQRLKDDAKWDVLANDLADSLVSSLLPQQQFGSEAPGSLPTPTDMPIYPANRKPLDESERQKFPSILAMFPEAGTTQAPQSTSTNKQDGDFDISNLFNLLFGKHESEPTVSSPSPSSSTMSPDQTTASPSSTHDSTSTDAVLKEMADMLGESLSTTVADDAKSSSQSAQTKESLSELVNANIMPTTASSTSANDKKDAKATTDELGDDFVSGLMSANDLFGKMLTMAQFGNDQPQRSTSDSSSGGSSGGSSSSGSNSLRETMLCNCQKVSGNSTSSRQQSGNLNTSSTRAGGNSGSSGNGGSSNRGGSSSSYGTGGGGGGSSSSGGSSSNGGSSSGNRAGSSSSGGGDRDSSNRRNGSLEPIGYVPYSGRPENAPSAFTVGSLMAEPARHRQSSSYQQDSGESAPAELVTNAQPGSLLSALNNSPNQLLPRIIERLNNTSVSSLNSNSNDSYPILVTPLI